MAMEEKGMALGKRGMARRHAKRGWGKHYERYRSYRMDTISIRKITKGNNSTKNAGGATDVNHCTSSGHAILFYQVL